MKLEGIVLRIIRYKESSAIAHVLTDDYGLISIMCQGIYRNKNWVIPPALETMSVTNFVLNEGRTMYYLDEIESTKRMDILSESHSAFLSAHILSEIILKTLETNYVLSNIYPLTKTYLLNLTEENAYFLTAAWILKYMSFLGYKPFITDEKLNLYLTREGVMALSEIDYSGKIFNIDSADKEMLKIAINSPFKAIKDFKYDRLLEIAVNYAILNIELNSLNSFELLKNWRFYG